jgi:protocatechuate 3,4-dioxygenase beta subunit
MNRTDGILNRIEDPNARRALIVDFQTIPNSRIGALQAKFDIVLGFTPQE